MFLRIFQVIHFHWISDNSVINNRIDWICDVRKKFTSFFHFQFSISKFQNSFEGWKSKLLKLVKKCKSKGSIYTRQKLSFFICPLAKSAAAFLHIKTLKKAKKGVSLFERDIRQIKNELLLPGERP